MNLVRRIPLVDEFLSWVRENAAAIDRDVEALRAALGRMAEAGLLGARVPKEHGGLGWTDRAYREFEESLARASGALAFVQAQHQGACAIVARSPKEELRAKWLPKLARGGSKAALAIAHLREPGAPLLMAVPKQGERWYEATGDYTLMGTSQQVGGWGICDVCVTAATRTDAQTIFFVHALDVKEIEASPVRERATVALYFRGLAMTAADVVLEESADWIERSDRASDAT